MADQDGMTVGIAGGAHMPFPVSIHQDPGFLNLVDLFRRTSAAFACPEGVIREDEDWPNLQPGMEGGTVPHFFNPPSIIDQLRFLGITALCMANNHAGDFGEGGYLTSIKYLRQRGMPFAGIGASLTEASMPCYVETAHGRVALIGVGEYGPQRDLGLPVPWPIGFMPSDELPPFRSRPGMNLVSYDGVFQVDQACFEHLRTISQAFGWERGKANRREGAGEGYPINRPNDPDWERDTDTVCFFLGRKFVRGDSFRVSTFAYQEDLDRVYRWVREARRQADVVVVIYNYVSHAPTVADYAREFGRGVIDAGADIFDFQAGSFKGIEIYKGKPIMYGGSSLYMENHRMTQVPSSHLRLVGLGPEATPFDLMEARVASGERARAAGGLGLEGGPGSVKTVVFDQHGEPKELRIHPIESMRGYPRLVEVGSEPFQLAMKRAIERCASYGVTVDVRDGAGVVRIK